MTKSLLEEQGKCRELTSRLEMHSIGSEEALKASINAHENAKREISILKSKLDDLKQELNKSNSLIEQLQLNIQNSKGKYDVMHDRFLHAEESLKICNEEKLRLESHIRTIESVLNMHPNSRIFAIKEIL